MSPRSLGSGPGPDSGPLNPVAPRAAEDNEMTTAETVGAAQRRACERYQVSVPVWLLSADGVTLMRTQTSDIGRQGAMVLVDGPSLLWPGRRIGLRLAVPGNERTGGFACVTTGAVVRHVSRLLSEDGDCYGVGLQFDRPVELPFAGS